MAVPAGAQRDREGWAALVVHVPFEGAVAMEWVPAERVEPIVDPAPQER